MTKQNVTRRYVDVKGLSIYTSIPIKTLYEWASVGKIPSIPLGRKILFDLVDIDRLMTSLKRTNNQQEKTINKIIRDIDDNDI
ncbi:MAG: helix-turn-helix domain-containing protein [Planctomycetota bacterium]|jgi:hypothetical protein